eukprot:TRINITY_DN6118_c0_g1_i1.p1 TRINITY_DN6118_c0_g1~~TRINITY_DN6118_c0_g1_i1.p1  ORF type:complete len:401 (-),score=66.38 TRINITY_DN6118_c0_g1_i1:90-1292(-)
MEEAKNEIVSINFNHDNTHMSVSMRNYSFKVLNIDTLEVKHIIENYESCSIIDYMKDNNTFFTVGTDNSSTFTRRVLRVFRLKSKPTLKCGPSDWNELGKWVFEENILAVKVNSKRFAVVLQNEIHLYSFDLMSFIIKIDTGPNLSGLCELSPGTDDQPMLMVYPNVRGVQKGNLIVYDPISLQIKREVLDVHQHPLQTFRYNKDGEFIATASVAGTLIRVIKVLGERNDETYSFRRGSQKADINCIVFDQANTYIASSSSSGTVHIFNLKDGKIPDPSEQSTWTSMLYIEGIRSFARLTLPADSCKHLKFSPDSSQLYTVTKDGKFSKWQIPKVVNNSWSPCKLLREDNLLKIEDGHNSDDGHYNNNNDDDGDGSNEDDINGHQSAAGTGLRLGESTKL